MESLTPIAKTISQAHFDEWKKSSVSQEIIELNVKSLKGDSVYERLCYGIDRSQRRNDGRLPDKYLNRYKQAELGGWWCSGIDLLTMLDSDWGCFKADKPRKSDKDIIKYEVPCGVPTEIFALKVSDKYWKDAIKYHGFPKKRQVNFWQWVVDNPVPIIITEGAKKAGALLTAGHIAVALPGVHNTSQDGELKPQLKLFACPGREIIFCFDQDDKWQTKLSITQAIKKTGSAFEDLGCTVSVMVWDKQEGKGIDDFLAKHPGVEKLDEIYQSRLTLEVYLDKHERVKKLDKASFVKFLQSTYKGRLAYNELTWRVELDGEPIELSGELCFKLIEEHMIDCSVDAVVDGFHYEAKKRAYHPVKRYLESCVDKEPISIDNVATRYLGIPETDPLSSLYNVYIKKWLIAAVARAVKPGCKVDYALILQSSGQGIGKSTFFQVLGGKWHDSSAGANVESPKSLMVFHRCWIQEWDEFDKISGKRDAEEIKSFITNPSDRFVRPYGRDTVDHPRRFILAGTVNRLDFLVDETGNRRFLVIPIPLGHRIDNATLRLERDRIWGEASRLYLEAMKADPDAVPWKLEPEEESATTEANKQFMLTDEWQFMIEDYLIGHESTTIAWLMEKLFYLEAKEQTSQAQKRIARCLKMLGWYSPGPKRNPETGKLERRWYSPITRLLR